MTVTLRDDQQTAIEKLRESYAAGRRRIVMQAPTGFGKTVLAGALVKRARELGNRVIFTAPALSLIDQTVDSLRSQGIADIGVLQANHRLTDPSRPVQVASVSTLARREIPPADVVIIDECFAAGTKIETPLGLKAIQDIRPGDAVFNATGIGFVKRVVVSRRSTITVRLSNGQTVRTTKDHPFFTNRGWHRLEERAGLFSREALRKLWRKVPTENAAKRKNDRRGVVAQAAFLLDILREEIGERDLSSRGTSQVIGNLEADWASAQTSWQQLAEANATAVAIMDRTRVRVGFRIPGTEVSHRHRQRSSEDRHRDRRPHAFQLQDEGAGSAKGSYLSNVWVDDITSNECASPETVYDLRISGHPSYFAGGVLVGNCHRWYKFYEQWLTEPDWAEVPFIGLSATPWTKGLGKWFEELIVAGTTAQCIEAGTLSPFKVYAPSHPDLTGVKIVAGDYHEGQLSRAMSGPSLVADIVTTWLARGESRPTLCFCVNCKHAELIQAQFAEAGVPCGYQDAGTPMAERTEIKRKFHSGEYSVVCNVGTLTTGVDWDVRCIVLARPTKSEMLFVQIVGRGLRTAPGKDHCLARGTLVLTDKGEIPIEHITLDHRLWDGHNFVTHGGAVCRGVQPVMTYDGLTATPDHKVMTNAGWETIATAARACRRITRTGIGGHPLRFVKDCVEPHRGDDLQSSCGSFLQTLWQAAYGVVSQHTQTSANRGLPALQWASTGDGAAVALRALPSAAGSLLQSNEHGVSRLRQARYRVSVSRPQRSRALGGGQPRDCQTIDASGSDRQRWPLRARQSAVVNFGRKHEQHPQKQWLQTCALHCFSTLFPRCAVRRQNIVSANQARIDRQADYEAMGAAVTQTKREVWDILNVGPLQRFTANGRLTHNCLILDHSDNHTRLGFVTDIHHEVLDDGKPKPTGIAPPRPEPVECPSCGHLNNPGTLICSECGYQLKLPVTQEDGELEELKAPPPRVPLKDQKITAVYGGLLWIANERGFKPGWVAYKFKEIYGYFPQRGWNVESQPPSKELLAFVRQQYKAWARTQRAAARIEEPDDLYVDDGDPFARHSGGRYRSW